MPIDTPQDLRDHLALAIQVEMTTIPPYLYAMYSIADPSTEAAQLIRSVVAEEMLHAALMANLLLSIGGEPTFYDADRIPSYPGPLPHHIPELMVSLEKCTPEVIRRVFMTIERPASHEAPPEPDEYETLGQFYHALHDALLRLDEAGDLFAVPQVNRQLGTDAYSPVAFDSETSGGLIAISDITSACDAIDTVVHQGEGLSEDRYADPEHRELTHYAKFLRLAEGEAPLGVVMPAVTNPAADGMPASIRPVAELANAAYCYLLVILDRLFAPDEPAREALVGTLYGAMSNLGTVARYLMTLDVGQGEVAGPPFGYHHFASPADAENELRTMAAAVAADHPELQPILDHL